MSAAELMPAPAAMPSPYLFGTDRPREVIRAAADYAAALAEVIEQQRLYTEFRDKRTGTLRRHVNVEGWALLASMLGIATRIETVEPIYGRDAEILGYEAYAEAYRGEVRIGNAYSICTRRESNWAHAADYALLGMAQTRAISRALRIPLGMVVVLAGFDATPAEEMPVEEPAPAARKRQRRGEPDYARRRILELAADRNVDADGLAHIARSVGVEGTATAPQLAAMIALLEALPQAEPPAEPPADEPAEPPADEPVPGQLTIDGEEVKA